jgi:LmbE family N-acetylglucosaminyl deacetylase
MIRNYVRRAYRSLLPVLYARTNFKLFLKAAVGDVDLRVQQLASVSDYFAGFVRPIPIQAPFGNSMLVLAPHQDDEAIGCGGALALQVRSGRRSFVVMLEDGCEGYQETGMTRQELADLRNEESRRAAAVLGMEAPFFLGHADLTANIHQVAEQLGGIIRERRADAIFTPWLLDGHPAHRTANYALVRALRDIEWDVRVFGYEVWGLCIPNVIVVIDDVMDKKLEMLSAFHYANRALDYVRSTQGLNMYHTRLLGSGMSQYAECFFEVPANEYIELVKRVHAAEFPLRRIGESFFQASP